jgi:hypothetical protein
MNPTHFLKTKKQQACKSMQNAYGRITTTLMASRISATIIILAGVLAWQCSKKNDTGSSQSLKESLNTGTQNLNTAVTAISQSYGYKIIALKDENTMKSALASDASFQDSITLAQIKGEYEYQPITYTHWCYSCFTKLFKRTADNNHLIVKLPDVKVFFPYKFQNVTKADSTLKNNLVIDASDYHYYFSWGFLWDYKLAAGITKNDTAIGSITVQSSRSSGSGYAYNSSYTFPNGYNIAVNVKSGDTTSSSITLSDKNGTLLKETVNHYKTNDSKFHEKEYILDIGNVEFKKASGADSIRVYVSGVLQAKAKVEIIDASGSANSVLNGRDIKVTFDDGTSATLSGLLGPSVTILQGIYVNLQNVYFAKNIVDYIAFNIAKNKTP